MTQNSSKIQGKFYPLQHEEWLRACRDLKPAEKDLLYYIRTLDPYNQGVDINCAEIARLFSTSERIVHRQTVSRALKELDAKGFIDLELLQVKAKVKPKGLWCDETLEYNDAPRCDETPRSIATHRDRSPHTQVDRETPRSIATHHTESESFVEPESQNSKINKINKTYKDSLSEDERERFSEFANKKASELPTPPTLPGKWIEANFEELKELFEKQESSIGSTHCGVASSTVVQNFDNWDEINHEGQYMTLMNIGLAKFCENATSSAWYEWAIAKHPSKFTQVPD
ncbi:MarR family transcriptional regulator [Brunnivagina elsteri]|uniref:MarR family transcriptional regulator n=1 Tax=Brunnivagina elsteri TaxID=1247191 RepID=UPI001B80CDBF|nr:helix-turn-helix domain-containing protein [Calothrix elsteri]